MSVSTKRYRNHYIYLMHKGQPHLVITKQPNHVWYKDVGGKKACIDFVVSLEGNVRALALSLTIAISKKRSRFLKQKILDDVHYVLELKLCFENGEQVDPEWQDIFQLQEQTHQLAVSKKSRECEIRYRIEKVSTAFQGKRFSVLVEAIPRVTDKKKLHILKGLKKLSPILTTPTLVKAKPKRQSKTKANSARLNDMTKDLADANVKIKKLGSLVRYCLHRIDTLEKRLNPVISRQTSLDPTPVVLGPSIDRSISERSEPEYPLPGVPPDGLNRIDSNNSTAESMIVTAAVVPPGPPSIVRSLSAEVAKIKGAPPTFERLSSSDGGPTMLRLNTTDLNLLMLDMDEVVEEEDDQPALKKRRTEQF